MCPPYVIGKRFPICMSGRGGGSVSSVVNDILCSVSSEFLCGWLTFRIRQLPYP